MLGVSNTLSPIEWADLTMLVDEASGPRSGGGGGGASSDHIRALGAVRCLRQDQDTLASVEVDKRKVLSFVPSGVTFDAISVDLLRSRLC